ncbi:hypothetical protein K1719_045664 [Acacia pycnantha]|nr:hypothetical protein K1719_045664 [Acacia pycnantha]
MEVSTAPGVTTDQPDNEHPTGVVENFSATSFHSTYLDDGDASHECQFCAAQLWFEERLKGLKKNATPQFGICCCNGKIVVSLLQRPPEELHELFFNKQSMSSKNFLNNIRSYNMFCFTSMGGKIDHSINSKGGGPYSFVLSGQNHHLIGSLLPPQGNPPVYSQLYIYDTENEIAIEFPPRHGHSEVLDDKIVKILKQCLDKHNCVVRQYRRAAEIIKENVIPDVSIRLIRNSNSSSVSKQYNMPTTSELAALIRIDELHMAYLPLQYPLIFPYGDNGFDSTNEHSHASPATTKKKKKLTPREYLAFRLMRRKSEISVILHAKKLLQQFIVDGYAMVESDRLDYIKKHQKELRVDLYGGLSDAVTRGEMDPLSTGRRVILPSSFTGGARYMIRTIKMLWPFVLGLVILDIFITFTCNPMWPKLPVIVRKMD